jgi:hypothetical protein
MLFDYKLREGVVTKSSLVDLSVVIAKPCVLCGFREHPQDLKHLFSEENLMVRIWGLSRSQFASGEVELKGSEQNTS